MTLLPSHLPSPRAALTRAGSGLRTVLTSGLDAAQSLVDRLPGPDDGRHDSPDGGRSDARPASPTIGSGRRRRHGSQASRSLAR